MVVTKGLLFKGLGVCALCAGGATTVALKWGDIKGGFSPSSNLQEKKIVRGNLECEDADGGICSLNGEIFVRKKTGTPFKLTELGEEGGKIKVYKVEGKEYKDGFKFFIDEKDINGTGDNNKLEEFETYEVKKGEVADGEDLKGKYYLSLKTDVKEGIKKALGLPWELTDESKEHTGINNDQLKDIKFKGGTATVTGESVTLTISKEATKTEYPLSYKFTFKNTSETAATLRIGDEAITLKKDSPIDYDFRIKREGFSLSLEKAWSLETFAAKVGLVKESTGDYWDVGTEGLNVKINDSNKTKKTKKEGTTGKIKVYEGQAEYNGGFRFTIEVGNLVLKDSATTDITLEEFQSYELVKDGDNNWYLSKKEEAKEGIKRALGFTCEIPTGQDSCSLTTQNIGTVKFKGDAATLSGGTVTLTVSSDTSKTEFPYSFKFTLKNTNDSDAILKMGKETLTLKKNSPVEFKIKKEGSSISLERAWTIEKLTEKVGLVKQSDGSWNVGNSGLNIKQGTAKHTKKTKKDGSSGKIKVYEDQAGYNEGFKFILEDGDITLNNGGSNNDIILGQFHGYEIVKEESTWYFSRKDEGQEKIKELLGLGYELPKEQNSKEYTLTNENIKTTKFDGAENKSATVTGSPKLTISKETERIDFPLGYKFVFSSESNSTITIPTSSPSTPYIIKGGLSVDYKIKRNEKNKNLLSLGKAWDPNALMETVWFKKEKDKNEWVAGTDTVNIKHDSHKSTSLKAKSGSNHAKIRVYEGASEYQYGMKFMVEDGDTTFEEAKDSISKLTKYETYEISKDSGEWYLSRKLKAEESMRELLGLPKDCSMPTNAGTSNECDLDSSKLNEIKFKDKGTGSISISSGGTSVKLAISKESSETEYPKGFKFTFKPENKEFTIPQGSSSLTVKNNENNEFKIKENGNTLTLEKVG